MKNRIFLSILLFQVVVLLVWLAIQTYSGEPARVKFDVRQETGTVVKRSNRTSPNKARSKVSSVATVTEKTEPLTARDPEEDVFSSSADGASGPGKVSSLSTNTASNPEEFSSPSANAKSNPDKVSSLSVNTESNPAKVSSLSVNTESNPAKVSPLSVNTESNPAKVSSLSVNTETDPGQVTSMSVDTDSDPHKRLSPYMMNLNDSMECKEAKDKGDHPFVLTPQTKLILLWQYENDRAKRFKNFRSLCATPTVGHCETTTDLSYRSRADAVVIHASRIFTPILPFPKLPGQIWIARGLESPVHWHSPYRSPQWKGVFNWTFTYRPDSELFSPIGQLVKIPGEDLDYRKIARSKKRSVAWFVSDCSTKSKREDYVNEMRKYIDVDIYGECGKLKCSKNDRGSCFELLSTTYRFYLSFENSLCNYYITEKFFNKLGNIGNRYHVIPVVRGGTDYRKYFPEGTFIDAADFQSPKALAMYLNELGNDVDAYAALLKKKNEFGHYSCTRGQVWCKMCDMLHNPNLPPKVYNDIGAWWDQAACVEPTDI